MYRSSVKHNVFYIAIAFSVLAISISDAWMALMPKVYTIDGKCIHPQEFNKKLVNIQIPANEYYYPPGRCEAHLCDYKQKSISIFGCGVVSVPQGCRAKKDMTKKYPDCCTPEIICPNDFGSTVPGKLENSVPDNSGNLVA